MITIDYRNRPSTDEDFVYRSLGSFWTTIFRDKDALKGYTRGQVQEIIQRYQDLVEVINNYSVTESPILHKENWYPIVMLKSQLNHVPFVFEENNAVFGAQPETDAYYHDIIFRFGFDKEATQNVYQYFVGTAIKGIGLIADRLISPNRLYIQGADVVLENGTLTFNSNIFEDEYIEKSDVVGDDGEPITFVDTDGQVQQEQSAIIWVYSATIDKSYLYNNFGYVFNLKMPTGEKYKQVLELLFRTYTDGPTVANIKTISAIALDIPIVLSPIEYVESIFDDPQYNFIVTDKNCYKLKKELKVIKVNVGQALYAGDLLSTNVEYHDNSLSANGWWKKEGLIGDRISFSKYLFLGSYSNQLAFSNELSVISLTSTGNIVFPVIGNESDVTRFNNFLNNSVARKNVLKTHFNLVNPGDTSVFIPLDFIMDNFMKLNIAFMKFVFTSNAQMDSFMEFIPLIRSSLPPYIYLIVKIDVTIDTEEYNNLNGELIEIGTGEEGEWWMLNADASDENGYIEPTIGVEGYTNLSTRLFEIGRALTPQPYEMVTTTEAVDATAESEGRIVEMKEGALLYNIPNNATTATVNKLLFLDFS